MGGIVCEGAAGTFQDGIEGDEDFSMRLLLLLAAGAFARTGFGDLG